MGAENRSSFFLLFICIHLFLPTKVSTTLRRNLFSVCSSYLVFIFGKVARKFDFELKKPAKNKMKYVWMGFQGIFDCACIAYELIIDIQYYKLVFSTRSEFWGICVLTATILYCTMQPSLRKFRLQNWGE